MFSGLVREIAKVVEFDGRILHLKAKYRPNLGDSIAVNGACLSVVEIFTDGFSLEISAQSKKMLALENFKNAVHIEPALCLGQRIDGHFIQGHIDFIGTIAKIQKCQNGHFFYINLPQNAMKFVSNQGSIAINGISLTIANCQKNTICVCVIPITMQNTLFGTYKVGTKVFIETDLFARYIYAMISRQKDEISWNDIDKILSVY